jgi:hypothetical protein
MFNQWCTLDSTKVRASRYVSIDRELQIFLDVWNYNSLSMQQGSATRRSVVLGNVAKGFQEVGGQAALRGNRQASPDEQLNIAVLSAQQGDCIIEHGAYSAFKCIAPKEPFIHMDEHDRKSAGNIFDWL